MPEYLKIAALYEGATSPRMGIKNETTWKLQLQKRRSDKRTTISSQAAWVESTSQF